MQNIVEKFSQYLKQQGLSKNTVRNYLVDISRFISYFETTLEKDFSDTTLSEVNTNFINGYLKFLKNNKTPQTTVKRYLATIKKFFSWANPKSLEISSPGENFKTSTALSLFSFAGIGFSKLAFKIAILLLFSLGSSGISNFSLSNGNFVVSIGGKSGSGK